MNDDAPDPARKAYEIARETRVRNRTVLEKRALFSGHRHRQFGVLVTTSFVDLQAYKEIIEDKHPIVVIAASDIVEMLRSHGFGDASQITAWLEANAGVGKAVHP